MQVLELLAAPSIEYCDKLHGFFHKQIVSLPTL